MIDKIIDKYFMRKLAKTLSDRVTTLMYVDIQYIEFKNKIEVYVNYKETKRRLQEYRKVCVINRYDVIHAIANFKEYEKIFIERVEETLR